MRKAIAIAVLTLVLDAGSASAQGAPSGDIGRGKTNPVGTGGDDIPGTGGGWGRKYDANGRMSEKAYRAELARSIVEAQALVGRPLTERDRGKIRAALRDDLIAWRKQYDPRRAEYRDVHDRWLVDEASLSPDAWAKQRVEWLRAQQQWILANVGAAEAIRQR